MIEQRNGVGIKRLGDSRSDTALVVIGRSNWNKRSVSLDSLIAALTRHGICVYWFRTAADETGEWLDRRFHQLFPALYGRYAPAPSPWAKTVRAAVKLGLLCRKPQAARLFLRERGRDKPIRQTEDLTGLLDDMPQQRIHLIGHSAGGITATLAAGHPKVARMVCFGYPIRHPKRAPESYRAAPLAGLRKPLLIIQGDDDDYGSANTLKGYPLSPAIRVEPIATDHDYDGFSPAELARLEDMLVTFLGLA